MRRNDALMIGVLVFESMLGMAVTQSPETLGIPVIALNWLMILNVGVVALVNQLDALGDKK